MNPRPCSPMEAVDRACRFINEGVYFLSAGGFKPDRDSPWTKHNGKDCCDCFGLIKFAYKIPGERPGFNKGPWATVIDDVNCDSAIEDAEHHRELFISPPTPQPGDLIVWPSIRGPREIRIRIGHVAIVVSVMAREWDPAFPSFELLNVVQCQSQGTPAILATTGRGWIGKEAFRGQTRDAWRSRLLRLVP